MMISSDASTGQPDAPDDEPGLDQRIASFDWSASPLGPADRWPQSLRTTVELMLSSRHAMMLAWGPDLTLLYNDAYAPFLGLRHPDALGRPFRDVWSEIWSDIEPLVTKAMAGQATWFENYHLVMERNGYREDTWWNFSYSPTRDDDGAIVGMLNVTSEMTPTVLTERRQTFRIDLDRRLRQLRDPQEVIDVASQALGRYLGAAQVGYAEIDATGDYAILARDWNDGTMASNAGRHQLMDFGLPFITDLKDGKTIAIGDVRHDPRTSSAQALATFGVRGIAAFLNVPLIKGGRLVAVVAVHHGAPRPWTPDEILLAEEVAERTWEACERALAQAALFDLNDTLELRIGERTQELEMAHEQLRQSQKLEAMGTLTGGVAHDFNNLLTPILGALDMLVRKRLGGDREQRLIDGALQSAERARTLVQRLLAFARRQPLQPTTVDFVAVMESMAELIRSTLGPQIAVDLTLAPDLPPAIADPNQLEMALLNLAVNARDAMPDGGELRIAARADEADDDHRAGLTPGRYVLLSVADTGVGMDDATRQRAVDPFFSTKGIGKGTGLGLSMVHGLAAQLGGGLLIESAPMQGTTVELWLPASREAPSVEEIVRPAPKQPFERGVVMLVDDEDLVRVSTAAMLEEMGFDLVQVGSAQEALRQFEAGARPDVVITDHLMPGLSGVDLVQALARIEPSIPVLIVSGYADVEGIGSDIPRLTKPFRKDELEDSLADLMTRRRG